MIFRRHRLTTTATRADARQRAPNRTVCLQRVTAGAGTNLDSDASLCHLALGRHLGPAQELSVVGRGDVLDVQQARLQGRVSGRGEKHGEGQTQRGEAGAGELTTTARLT